MVIDSIPIWGDFAQGPKSLMVGKIGVCVGAVVVLVGGAVLRPRMMGSSEVR